MPLERLLEIVAPPLCAACGANAGAAEPLCERCRADLRWLGPEPVRLGAGAGAGAVADRHGFAGREPPGFAGAHPHGFAGLDAPDFAGPPGAGLLAWAPL